MTSTGRSAGPRRWVPGTVGLLGGLLLSLGINYHGYLPDLSLMPGNTADVRLMIFTLEHWLQAFRGHEAPLALNMFYPDYLGLAYADGLLLFAIPYSAFRALGMDYFSSYQWLLPFMTVLGFFGWFVLFRRAMDFQTGWAVLGAVLLVSFSALQREVRIDNGKMTALHLYPWMILWLWSFASGGAGRGWARGRDLAAFCGTLGLLFMTSYYVAWFFVFTAALVALICLVEALLRKGGYDAARDAAAFVRASWRQLLIGILALGVSMIPFVATYWPLIKSDTRRAYSLVIQLAPRVQDLVSVSATSWLWVPVFRALDLDLGASEVPIGGPILILLVAAVGVIRVLREIAVNAWNGLSSRERAVLILSLATALLLGASLKFGEASAWYWVYRFVPGASAMRSRDVF